MTLGQLFIHPHPELHGFETTSMLQHPKLHGFKTSSVHPQSELHNFKTSLAHIIQNYIALGHRAFTLIQKYGMFK